MKSQNKKQRKKEESEDDSEYSESRSRGRRRDRTREKKPRIYEEEESEVESDEPEEYEEEEGEGEGDQNEQNIELQHHKFNNQTGSDKIVLMMHFAFLHYFGSVKHEKGFVFTPQQRKKLIKEQEKNSKKNNKPIEIHWTSECEWEEKEEKKKVQEYFKREDLNLTQKQQKLMSKIFLDSSCMFGKQTTCQVYRLLMQLLKIFLHCKANNQDQKASVKEFITNMRKDQINFKFFNYKYSKDNKHQLPKDGSVDLQKVFETLGNEIYEQIRLAMTKK